MDSESKFLLVALWRQGNALCIPHTRIILPGCSLCPDINIIYVTIICWAPLFVLVLQWVTKQCFITPNATKSLRESRLNMSIIIIEKSNVEIILRESLC